MRYNISNITKLQNRAKFKISEKFPCGFTTAFNTKRQGEL